MQRFHAHLTIGQRIAVTAILAYRNILSHMVLHQCRFFPSCSVYAEQTILANGLRRGAWQTLKRLFRCHPFCESGVDPI